MTDKPQPAPNASGDAECGQLHAANETETVHDHTSAEAAH